jgi:hypothetical protein
MPSRTLGEGGRYGLGADPGLHHGDSGPELLARNEYLAAENRILTAQLKGRLKLLSVAERATLGEIGHRLGSHGERELGLGL